MASHDGNDRIHSEFSLIRLDGPCAREGPAYAAYAGCLRLKIATAIPAPRPRRGSGSWRLLYVGRELIAVAPDSLDQLGAAGSRSILRRSRLI
jgi:hypothetical protein